VPSKNLKQHNLMEAVAHNKGFAKKVGVPQSVGKDFAAADKGKQFKTGGSMKKHDDVAQDKALIKKMISPSEKKEAKGMKKGGKCMAKGGATKETMGPKTMSKDVEKGSNKLTKLGESAVQKRGKTKGVSLGDSGKIEGIEGFKPKKFAKGGCARADGIAQKGKTKGRYI